MADPAVVHVVDDDDAVRDSLAFVLESGGYQTYAYELATDALGAIVAAERGCVVTDVRMPGMSGVDLLRELRSRGSAVPVIVITGHGDVELAVEAMKAGASDFLEKPFADELLLAAVERVLRPREKTGLQNELEQRLGLLSRRELQVLARLVEGQLNKTIGHELGISMRTVEVYRAKLMSKMKAESFADLIRMAVQVGLPTDRPD